MVVVRRDPKLDAKAKEKGMREKARQIFKRKSSPDPERMSTRSKEKKPK